MVIQMYADGASNWELRKWHHIHGIPKSADIHKRCAPIIELASQWLIGAERFNTCTVVTVSGNAKQRESIKKLEVKLHTVRSVSEESTTLIPKSHSFTEKRIDDCLHSNRRQHRSRSAGKRTAERYVCRWTRTRYAVEVGGGLVLNA